MKLESLSYQELLELQKQIGEALPKAKTKARGELISRMSTEAEKHGLTIRDVLGQSMRQGKTRVERPTYRNPANPRQTWHGMGRPPRWLTPDMRR